MKRELLTYREPKSPISEVFRTLRTNIQFMNTDKKLKTLLVTSTFPEEGKSWVTSNLAVTFAQAGKKVILIDADMRKGRQYNIFNVLPKPGLSNYLSNMDSENMEVSDVNIINYIQQTNVENLSIIAAGNVPPNPSELLVSGKMRELLKQLKEMCDLIIIDGTPCDLVTDSIILSRYVDSTLVVAVPKKTKKENLSRIVKNIQNVGGKIAGVVVNKVNVSSKKYSEAYYYGSISGNSSNKNQQRFNKNEQMIENFLKLNIDKLKNHEEDEKENEEKQEIFEDLDISKKEEKIVEEIIAKEKSIDNVQNDIQDNIQENVQEDIKVDEQPTANIDENKNFVELAPSAQGISEDKTTEIFNLVNNYVEEEKQRKAQNITNNNYQYNKYSNYNKKKHKKRHR